MPDVSVYVGENVAGVVMSQLWSRRCNWNWSKPKVLSCECCGMVVMVMCFFSWSCHRRCSAEASAAEDAALCPPQSNHHPPALPGDVWKPAAAADQCWLPQHGKAELFSLSQLAGPSPDYRLPSGDQNYYQSRFGRSFTASQVWLQNRFYTQKTYFFC